MFHKTLVEKKLPEQRTEVYCIGEDRWHSIPSWKEGSRICMELYLSGTDLQEAGYCGALMTQPPEKTDCHSYEYDPENPVSSIGGEGLLRSKESIGSMRMPDAGYRKDVVSFISPPLKEDVKIYGKIKVRLFGSTDAEDTAFVAKLMEVDELGRAYHIRSSITTLGHELSGGVYVPGKVVTAEIDMWDIMWQLHAGTRIRLDISSSDFPQYHIHSNYAGIWSLQTKTKRAKQMIYTGKDFPSCVCLETEFTA